MGMNRTLRRSPKGRARPNDGRRHIRGIRNSRLVAESDICVRRAIGPIGRPVIYHCTPLASERERTWAQGLQNQATSQGRRAFRLYLVSGGVRLETRFQDGTVHRSMTESRPRKPACVFGKQSRRMGEGAGANGWRGKKARIKVLLFRKLNSVVVLMYSESGAQSAPRGIDASMSPSAAGPRKTRINLSRCGASQLRTGRSTRTSRLHRAHQPAGRYGKPGGCAGPAQTVYPGDHLPIESAGNVPLVRRPY